MDEKPLFVRPTLRHVLGAIICLEMAPFIVLGLGDEPERMGCIVRLGWAVAASPLIPILVGIASGLLLEGSRINDWIEKASRPFLLVFLIWMLGFALRMR